MRSPFVFQGPPMSRPIIGGAGTELKKLLGKAGFTTSNCACDSRASEMDAKGIQWCVANIGTICSWLQESAASVGIPMPKIAAWLLVKSAINAARRKSAVDVGKVAE